MKKINFTKKKIAIALIGLASYIISGALIPLILINNGSLLSTTYFFREIFLPSFSHALKLFIGALPAIFGTILMLLKLPKQENNVKFQDYPLSAISIPRDKSFNTSSSASHSEGSAFMPSKDYDPEISSGSYKSWR